MGFLLSFWQQPPSPLNPGLGKVLNENFTINRL